MTTLMKRSLLGGDFNFRLTDLKGDVEKASGIQTIVYYFICDNGYSQIVSGPQEEKRCLIYTVSNLKARIYFVIFCPLSATITGFYWK